MARLLRRMRKEPRALSLSSCSVCLGRGHAVSWRLLHTGAAWLSAVSGSLLALPSGARPGAQTSNPLQGPPQASAGCVGLLGSTEQLKTSRGAGLES